MDGAGTVIEPGNSTAGYVGQADSRIRYLPATSLPGQLPEGLHNLRYTTCANWVAGSASCDTLPSSFGWV